MTFDSYTVYQEHIASGKVIALGVKSKSRMTALPNVPLPMTHWLEKLDEAGVPAGPMNDVAAMMADPQVKSRGILPDIRSTGGQRTPVTPILLSTQGYLTELPPVPGPDEHRDEILRFARGDAAPAS